MMTALLTGELMLAAEEVDELPWEPLNELPGVHVKTLWRDPVGSSYAGLMRIEPGASLPPHTHHYAEHHMWVVMGTCHSGDRSLSRGSYAYVPVGEEHGIDRTGPFGCKLFYLYLTKAEFD